MINESAKDDAVVLKGDDLVLSTKSSKIFRINFPETRHSGGELHKEIVI